MFLFLLVILELSNASNLDYLDIGLEYRKVNDVFYWTSEVTIQLVYEIPLPPSAEEFMKPRCDYALNARRSLYARFTRQFKRVARLSLYKSNCSRFEDPEKYMSDTTEDCLKCFHISAENDPYYMECLTLLELRHLCKEEKITRRKRDTSDTYVLSKVAVMLAEGAKTQDDRITEKFRHEHSLQKENVNFQLLFLNTFRWQMSLSELWFLRYVQSDPQTFARMLVHLSGILPSTKALTEHRINASLSDDWTVQSTSRNESHVSINVTFSSFNPEYKAELYQFRYVPVFNSELFFVVNPQDSFALKCEKTVVTVSDFEAHEMMKRKYVSDSPCHSIQPTAALPSCLRAILMAEPKARVACFTNAKRLPSERVGNFYFMLNNHIWFPKNESLIYTCPNGSAQTDIKYSSVVTTKCNCFYSVNSKMIPSTKTCSPDHHFEQIKSNYTLLNRKKADDFFLGQTSQDNGGKWQESAATKNADMVLKESELVESYFKKKLENEAGGSFRFNLGLSTLWVLLPIVGVLLLAGLICIKCRSNTGFGQVPAPVFVNYCSHPGENQPISMRPERNNNNTARVVSWGPGQKHACDV